MVKEAGKEGKVLLNGLMGDIEAFKRAAEKAVVKRWTA
jgi:tRNA U54 and U55 pseudouridine synthase Pus10